MAEEEEYEGEEEGEESEEGGEEGEGEEGEEGPFEGESEGGSIRQQIIDIGRSYYGQPISDGVGDDGMREGWQILEDIFATAFHVDPADNGLLSRIQSPGEGLGISWCGIFAVSCAVKAGVSDAQWQLGSAPSGLASGALSDGNFQPGDIVVFHDHIHHAIVASIDGDTLVTVNGNSFDDQTGKNSTVAEHTRSASEVWYYYRTVDEDWDGGGAGEGEEGEESEGEASE